MQPVTQPTIIGVALCHKKVGHPVSDEVTNHALTLLLTHENDTFKNRTLQLLYILRNNISIARKLLTQTAQKDLKYSDWNFILCHKTIHNKQL